MKPLALAVGLLVAGAYQAQAAPCVAGTLTSYLALGGAGCTIGSATLAGFTIFVEDDVDGGAVTVTPVEMGHRVGLTFGSIGTAADFTYLELLVGFTVAAPAVTGASAVLTGSTDDDGFGVTTGLTDLCLGGTFATPDPTSCSTMDFDTLVTALILGDIVSDDSRSFLAPLTLTGVLSTLTADRSVGGSATLTSYTNLFEIAPTDAPEPSTWLLCAVGLAMARRRWA